MTRENDYIASDLKKEADQERLRQVEDSYDLITIRHLERLGVAEGWKCLNVGAGYGSITSWLANKVGPQGNVVATDIRAELHREPEENVEIRQHNILTDEIEEDYYDLVFCRLLLQHLSRPEMALSNMAKAVKPGGWLLIEEVDNDTAPVSDSNNAVADAFYRVNHEISRIGKRFGLVNYEFGRRVRELMEKLGFRDVGSEGVTRMSRGGEPAAKFRALSMRAGWERVKNELTEEEKQAFEAIMTLDEMFKLLEDPSFYYVGNPLFCAWGKKPK